MGRTLKATDKFVCNRTIGVNTFMKLPLIEDVDELEDKDVDYAIVGIPDDNGGFFRAGQRFAPNSIRAASAMLRAINMEIGTNIDAELKGFDNGDVNCDPFEVELNQIRSAEKISKLTARGIIPVSMGGDHSITLGPVRAVAKQHGPVGLIHFDSHLDTYEDGFVSEYNNGRYHNGTTIKRGIEEKALDPNRIISIGIKGTLFNEDCYSKMSTDLGIEVITMGEFEKIGVEETIRRIRNKVGDGPTCLTFDIDCMDAAFCPGGALYELGGFTTREITSFTAAAFMHMFIAMIGVRKRNRQK